MATIINIEIPVDTEDIRLALADLSYEDILEFILDLDLTVADHDFTSTLIAKLKKTQ